LVYKVEFSARASRKLSSLPKDIQRRLDALISSLAANPRPAAAVKLKEVQGCYRLRRGSYRIIYSVRDDRLVVLVLSVVARKEAYTRAEIAAIGRSLKEWLSKHNGEL